jgi:putative MFS transporter
MSANCRRVTSVDPGADSSAPNTKAPAAMIAFAGIGRRLDRLPVTYLHLAVMAACAFGFTFDLLELGLGNVMSVVFSVSPSIMGASRLSWLLSAAFIGAIVGAPSFGWYAERHGPKRTLAYALALLAPASLALAGSREYGSMLSVRLLSGVALGAYPPLMIAYLTEILPPARRGMLILMVVACASFGPPAGIFLVRWLGSAHPMGFEAWRWGFIVGGMGAAAGGAAFAFLPESPRWLVANGQALGAESACRKFERSKILWQPGDGLRARSKPLAAPAIATQSGSFARRFLLLGALFFLSPWTTAAFPLLSGAALVAKGFNMSSTLLYVGISTLGTISGTIVAALFIDRFERRTAIVLCAASMALAAIMFALSRTASGLIAASLAFSTFAALYVPSLSIYAAELFPTRSRSAATSVTWGINRVAASLGPLVLLPLLHTRGVPAMFTVMASTLVSTIVLILAWGPSGLAGRAVD